jgi:UDP-glucose 4-epimerase
VVNGDGLQTRDYVFLDDVVEALIAAATARDVNRRVINVGSGQETSVQDLLAEIQKITGTEVTPLYGRRETTGVSRMCADISLAARTLGFQPRVSLAEGLRLTLERDKRFQVAAGAR